MVDYINKKYKPKQTELVCEYLVKPASHITIEFAASQIAAERSIGTWTTIQTMKPRIAKRLAPHVFSIERKSKNRFLIKIAYPLDLFEIGNMPQLLSAIAGNIFGMKILDELRLEQVSFPKKYLKGFKGPEYGIQGVREVIKVEKRPLLGTIVKPKVGLNPEEHAQVAKEAWAGGLDIVKDDENLTDMNFNNFKKRIKKTLEKRDMVESLTGEKKIYMPNVTAEPLEMLRRAEFVREQGGEYVMIDVLTAGFGAVQTLRDNAKGLVIHAHRAMHAALTRHSGHGISMLALAQFLRLIGVDQLHIGTAVGKMSGKKKEVKTIFNEIETHAFINNEMKQDWGNIKPVMAVCSGGLHPLLMPDLVKIFGNDAIFQFGGGCHGHPKGTRAGARALRQALDAVLLKIPLEKAAEERKELKQAFDKWGD